jgi:MYXO-CTERM domain-containing protein
MRRTVPLAAFLATVAAALPALALITSQDIVLVEDVDGKIAANATAPDAYLMAATCQFYKTNQDRYDVVFVYDASQLDFFSNTQQGWPVKQWERGIGRGPWNQTKQFCSAFGTLKQAVKMGSVDTMPDNPDDFYKGIPFYPLTGIELVGHEFGHHWMAAVTFQREDGIKHCMVRTGVDRAEEQDQDICDGFDLREYNQHWSYYFNSGGLMYGNQITQMEDGRFRIYNDGFKYGPLDQYLMGIRPAEDVPTQFVAYQGPGMMGGDFPAWPRKEIIIEGKRESFTVDDVIRDVGERLPPYGKEFCHWKGITLVVHPKGRKPTQKQIDKLVVYANRWEEFYPFATDYRGSFDMTKTGMGPGTPECPSKTVPIETDNGPWQPDVPVVQDDGPWQPDVPEGQDGGPVPPDPGAGVDVPAGTDPGPRDGGGETATGADGLGDTCVPGKYECDGNRRMMCDAQGRSWAFVENCTANGLVCEAGACTEGGGAEGGGCTAGGTAAPWGAMLSFVVLGAATWIRRRRP